MPVEFILSSGISGDWPTGVYQGFNPDVPFDQPIYAWALMSDFEGDFEVIFRFAFADGSEQTFTHQIPPASFGWYNVAFFPGFPMPAGAAGVEIDVGPQGGISMPFNVVGAPPEPPPPNGDDDEPPPPVPEETGIYGFTSVPTGMEIKVDGITVGNTPLEVERVANSQHLVEAIWQDFDPFSQSLTWPTAQTVEFPFSLQEFPQQGWWNFVLPFLIEQFLDFGLPFSNNILAQIDQLNIELTGEPITAPLAETIAPRIPGMQFLSIGFFGHDLEGNVRQPTIAETVDFLILAALAYSVPVGTARLFVWAGGRTPVQLGTAGTTIASGIRTSLFTPAQKNAMFKMFKAIPATLVIKFLRNPLLFIFLGLFAVFEPLNYFNMRIFARNQAAEAQGLDPSSVTFELNDVDTIFRDLMFQMKDALEANDKTQSQQIFNEMQSAAQTFENLLVAKSAVLEQMGFLEAEQENLNFMANYLTRVQELINALPDEPPATEGQGILQLDVVPSDATIFIPGQDQITSPGAHTLDSGFYNIEISKEGFETEIRSVIITEGETSNISVILEEIGAPPPPSEEQGSLILAVDPSDAIIVVPGQDQINAPGTFTLNQGSYSISVSKEGFESDERTFFINANETTNVSIALTPIGEPPVGDGDALVTITSVPTNSDVYIDGEFQFTTTPFTLFLSPGLHIFRVQTEGHFPQEIQITLEPGEVLSIPFTLTPIPPDQPQPPQLPPGVPFPPEFPSTPLPPGSEIITPFGDIDVLDFNLLFPELIFLPPVIPLIPSREREILINIETTDLLPWKGKIFSIAFLDLSKADQPITVMVNNNEQELMQQFMDFFRNERFEKIIGYNVSFDYRFIFAKMMLYRMQGKDFTNAELRDVMQILKQVKEEFVFGFNKPGKLDEWGRHLLGKGKLADQKVLLSKFLAGDLDFVRAFQTRQIEVLRDLYNLARFSLSEGFIRLQETIPATGSTHESSHEPIPTQEAGQAQCPNCLAFVEGDSTNCAVCGSAL